MRFFRGFFRNRSFADEQFVCSFPDENGDHVCMVMDGFFAELGQMLDHFDQFRYDIIEHFPFLNSTVEFVANQVRKITLLSEKLHGNERRDALQQVTVHYILNGFFLINFVARQKK